MAHLNQGGQASFPQFDLEQLANNKFSALEKFKIFIKNLENSYKHQEEAQLDLNPMALHKISRILIEHPENFPEALQAIPQGIKVIHAFILTQPDLLKLSWDPLYSNNFWKHFSKEQQVTAQEYYAKTIKSEDNNLLVEQRNALERANSALEVIEKFTKPSWLGFLASSTEKYRAAIYLKILGSDELSPFAKNVALYSLMSNRSDLQAFVHKSRHAHLNTLENFILYTVLRSPNSLLGKSERETLEKRIKGFVKQLDLCIQESVKSNNIVERCQPLIEELKQIEKEAGLDLIRPKTQAKNSK